MNLEVQAAEIRNGVEAIAQPRLRNVLESLPLKTMIRMLPEERQIPT